MLSVDLHCEQEMLGKVYAVLSKRRAKVQGEVLREGTSIFYVHAFLYRDSTQHDPTSPPTTMTLHNNSPRPLANSFDMARQLRQAASGHVTFHMAFSHWELSEDG
eukprot:Skav205997  [mRNA]  locus=scaffold2084:257840:258154:- [translate_table: standard]